MPFAGEDRGVLEFDRPDRVVGPGESRRVRRVGAGKGQPGIAVRVIESAHVVAVAVPSRIEKLPAAAVARQVAIRIVGKHVAGVVQDDVENDPHPVRVRRVHQRPEIVGRAEAGIDLEVILDAVSVIGLLKGHLLQNGAQPDRCHTQAL